VGPDVLRLAGALQFAVVDAFSTRPFGGNPAAVVLLDAPAADDWREHVAAEFNLSETAFLRELGPGRYELRWFTPTTEVRLCGHATLASAHWLWETGVETQTLVFATASGQLRARRGDDGITLDFPSVPVAEFEPLDGLDEALGYVDHSYLGSTAHAEPRERNAFVLVGAEALRTFTPDSQRIGALPVGGLCLTAAGDAEGVDVLSRYFAPACGIDEDPVTGSTHCTLAPYWATELGRSRLQARQLSARGGSLTIEVVNDRVELTGHATTVLDGRLRH
jgi:PhzF family phenazine biosynthesis protein